MLRKNGIPLFRLAPSSSFPTAAYLQLAPLIALVNFERQLLSSADSPSVFTALVTKFRRPYRPVCRTSYAIHSARASSSISEGVSRMIIRIFEGVSSKSVTLSGTLISRAGTRVNSNPASPRVRIRDPLRARTTSGTAGETGTWSYRSGLRGSRQREKEHRVSLSLSLPRSVFLSLSSSFLYTTRATVLFPF